MESPTILFKSYVGAAFQKFDHPSEATRSSNAHIINWRESYGQKRREVATDDNQMKAVTFLYLT